MTAHAIVVAGATGFVGRAVVDAARRHGHTVTPVSLRVAPTPPTAPGAVPDAVAHWRAAYADRWDALVSGARGADALINAAGAADPDSSDEAALWAANVLVPAVLIAAAAEAGVPRVVHISSAAALGPTPVLDDRPADPTGPLGPYARSKANGEHAATSMVRSLGEAAPELVVYRPTSVMGPERPMTTRLLRRFAGNVPCGGPDTPLPLALIDNVADAAVFLATTPHPPAIATHPDESMSVGRLTQLCGGTPRSVPSAIARTTDRAFGAAERRAPGVAGVRRRVELLLNGQSNTARALIAAGWTPPAGPSAWTGLVASTLAHPAAGDAGVSGGIRLAYVITRSDTVAGAQIHVRDLAQALGRAGNVVRVFVGGEGPYVDQLRAHGVEVECLGRLERELGPGDVAATLELYRALRRFNPDLISLHSSKAGILGRLVGRALGVPTIFTAHGWSFADGIPRRQRVAYTWAERIVAPLSARIITVAHRDRELALASSVGRAGLHRTIHNAVHDVDASLRARPDGEPPVVISIARFGPQKDHACLLRAVASVDPVPRVLLVGDGPDEAAARSLVAELGLEHHVEFLGLRHDIAELLSSAHIYALISNWEGLPRSIIEAMRAGLPIVASDVGGVVEQVDSGVSGFVVPRGDVGAVTDALQQLVDEPALRRQMGAASRQRFEAEFRFERVLEETRAVYRDVLGRAL